MKHECMRCKKEIGILDRAVCDDCLAKNPKLSTKEKTAINLWDRLEDFLKVYRAMKSGEWSWAGNTECKYVELRVDMRDGGCIIKDREGRRIGPERLAWQYSKEIPNPPED